MIGYVTLGTNDIEKAAGFYDALLGELGANRMMESQKSFERYVIRDPALPLPQLDYRLMPSTSAANAMLSVQRKIEAWSVIKEYLPASRD